MKGEREQPITISFSEAFRKVSKELSGAYFVNGIYDQSESISRFENGVSINTSSEFLRHTNYDSAKAADILQDLQDNHKINGLGVNVSMQDFLNLSPDSKANGRSPTITVLAQRAARLEAILGPDGIPEAYSLAQGQAKKALKLVEKAAEKAYNWNPAWGSLNVDNALNEAKGDITNKKVAQGAMAGILALAGCSYPVTPLPGSTETVNGNTPTVAEVVPTMAETLVFTPTLTPDPTQTETVVPTETLTPEVYDWNFVSQKTDEEVFNVIGIPDPAEYSLDMEISPYKILRNEGGQSYALFQNSEGIVVLAENIETKVIEHSVYAEYEGGVPVLLLTDAGVVKHDNGWFQLNNEYPASEAQERLAHAFNRALSMRWWGINHKEAGSLPYGVKDWLSEIPGFSPTEFDYLTRGEKSQISDYIFQDFIDTLTDARSNNSTVIINLPDANRVVFDAANEVLIIKMVLSDNLSWKPIYEHYMDLSHREVTSEESGKFLTLYFGQPSFLPSRGPRSLGGTITHFFRYFFGTSYFFAGSDTDFRRGEADMTGPILEDLCLPGSISDKVLYFIDNSYPAMDNFIYPQAPTNTCSVIFGK